MLLLGEGHVDAFKLRVHVGENRRLAQAVVLVLVVVCIARHHVLQGHLRDPHREHAPGKALVEPRDLGLGLLETLFFKLDKGVCD